MKTPRVLLVLLITAFSVLAFDATSKDEIINGKKVKKNSWQYMASVQYKGKHVCGGFLIHESYVLTAAHCKESGSMSVVLGTHNINSKRKNVRRYTVTPIPHESFKLTKNGSDIMLLKLSKKVQSNQSVRIIKLQSKSVKTGSKCWVAGWGATEKNQEQVDELLQAEVSIIDINICKKKWKETASNYALPPKVLCADGYETKSGACVGDSGGPLVCKGQAVGIGSFRRRGACAYTNVPDVYTDISKFIPWITEKIKKGA